jgi:GT2 family glycosyltransferase
MELEAERRRNLELAEQLRAAEAARAEAAALLARATNERAQLRRRADLAEREAAAARRMASTAIAERDVVLASTTWLATYPVRWLAGHLPHRLRRAIRGGAKLMWWTLTFRLVRELSSRGLVRPARMDPAEERNRPFDLTPPVLAPPVDPGGRRESIDIVVPVRDDPVEIKACLDAVVQFTLPPYRVILVDEGSGPETVCFLRRVTIEQGFIFLRVAERKGYAFAANAGIRASDAAWIVLLNSDAVVSPDWLDRMWAYVVADPKIGIIGPLSNTASWQSIRGVTSGLPSADSLLTGDCAIEEIAWVVANAGRGALLMPFLNRFYYMIRRTVLDEIGLFDEVALGVGDGAVNDFSIRARRAGWKLAVASDVYVHRTQSKSCPEADTASGFEEALARKHDPRLHIWPQVAYCNENLPMRARLRAKLLAERLSEEGRRRFEGLRIAIILPVCDPSMASQVVLQEARALERMGVNVTLLSVSSLRSSDDRHSEPLNLPKEVFDSPQLLSLYLCDLGSLYDAIVATAYLPEHWMPHAVSRKARYVYYVQDFEPASLSEDDPEYLLAVRSYDLHGGIRLVTKTRWNQVQLLQHTHKLASVLGPSVDIDPFGPADERMPGQLLGAVSIVANVRPSGRRCGAQRTIDVLEQVVTRAGCPISVQVFGASDSELARAGLSRPWLWNFGELSRAGRARLLSYADIFVDLSDYQPIGLTALEAMLSGAAAVVPKLGATSDFVHHGANGILVESEDRRACLDQIMLLLQDGRLRHRLQVAAITDAHGFVPEQSALTFLEAITADE